MRVGTFTATNSNLYWKVVRVYNIGDIYSKGKVLFFYKQTNEICGWLNPYHEYKNFKLLTDVVKHWEVYNPYQK